MHTPNPNPNSAAAPEAPADEVDLVAPADAGDAGAAADEGAERAAASAAGDVQARLDEAERKLAELNDAWLRARAETENLRRRAQEDVAKASKFAAEKFANAMLPVKDSLEAALATENQTVDSLREGVELTLKQLISSFEGASVTEENPLGQKFDPNVHQAISTVEADAEPNTVVTVLQKGYLLHGRVLRPALVMVARGKDA